MDRVWNPSCDNDQIREYQEALVEHGIPVEVGSREIFGAICGRFAQAKSSVKNAVEHGYFTDGKRHILILPPLVDVVEGVLKVLRAEAKKGDHASKTLRELTKKIEKASWDRGVEVQVEVQQQAEKCSRSPCGPDQKVSAEDLEAARASVGAPEKKTRPLPRSKFVVSYGLGVDSTAMLVGLAKLYREGHAEMRPDLILFADTGGEHPNTYAYLATMNRWLDSVGFPQVQVVAWATEHTAKGYGAARTLEQQCLINQTMPSIGASKFGASLCSVLWKQDVMNRWMELESGFLVFRPGEGWGTKTGGRIVKAIGYDATEENRAKKGTFRVDQEVRSLKLKGRGPLYEYWYPLMTWGWTRARCVAEIEAEVGKVPQKSSCWFCSAMTRPEIESLPKDLLMRALLIERVANNGRHRDVQSWGLGVKDGPSRPGRWLDFALDRKLITTSDVEKLDRWVEVVLAADPGAKGTDVGAQEGMARLPAFSDVRGFRGRRLPIWDRFSELQD